MYVCYSFTFDAHIYFLYCYNFGFVNVVIPSCTEYFPIFFLKDDEINDNYNDVYVLMKINCLIYMFKLPICSLSNFFYWCIAVY